MMEIGSFARAFTKLGCTTAPVMAAAFCLAATVVAAAPQTFTYFGPAVAIPEIGPNGTPAEAQLAVSGLSGSITGIDVSLTGNGACDGTTGDANEGVNHAWIGDLKFTLVSPSGTQIVLFNRPNSGGSGRICQVAFDDSATVPFSQSNSANSPFRGYYRPDAPLSTLNGQSPNGTWRLLVADYLTGDSGSLNRFSLHIETDSPASNASTPLVGISLPSGPTETELSSIAFTGKARNDRDGVSAVQYRVSQEADPALVAEEWLAAVDDTGSGSFASWKFTAALMPGDNYVDVRSVGPSGAVSPIARRMVSSSADFNPPPVIEFSAPVDPEDDRIVVFATGVTSFNFEGTASDPDGFVDSVQYRTEDETTYNATEFFDGDSWTQTVALANGDNFFTFRAIDDQGASSEEVQWRLIVTDGNIPPIVNADTHQIVAPDDIAAVTVSGSANDPDGLVSLVQYRVASGVVETRFDAPPAPRGPGNPWIDVFALQPGYARWTFSSSDLERPTGGTGSTATTVFQVRAIDNLGAESIPEEVEVTLVDSLVLPVVEIASPATDPFEVANDVKTIVVTGTATAGDNPTRLVRWRVTNSQGSTAYSQVTSTSGDTFATWNFQVSLAEGNNFIEVLALDSLNNSSVSTPESTLTVVREDDNVIEPTLVINFPVGDQTVSQSTASIPFSGTANDADGTLLGVIWQTGPSPSELEPPRYARNDSGDWTQWSFDAPLAFYENYIIVYAVDNDGNFSTAAENPADPDRIITREAAPADLVIVRPREGFVALNREQTYPFSGRAQIGETGLSLIQFRVTTETAFDAPVRAAGRQPVQTEWTPATNDSGDWTRWSLIAPFGIGLNLLEVQSLDTNSEEVATVSRSVRRLGPGTANDLMALSDDPSDAFGGDVWGSQNSGSGAFGIPARLGPTGFFHDPPTGWLSTGADFSGDGLTDFLTCTPFGVLFTVTNGGNFNVGPSQIRGSGYTVNPAAGQTVLVGRFNNDGFADVAQIEADGRVKVGLNDGVGGIPNPTLVADRDLVYDPEAGYWLEVGDVNGDGLDDIIQIRPLPAETEVVLANPAGGFFDKEQWGFTTFLWNPNSQRAVHVGDFNGDGLADLAHIDGATIAQVSLSTGESFSPPSQWGDLLGFHDDPARGDGWWVLTLDADGDGVDDLVQLNDIGEVWPAISTGRGVFIAPVKDASLGFHHKPFGPWQTVPGQLVP